MTSWYPNRFPGRTKLMIRAMTIERVSLLSLEKSLDLMGAGVSALFFGRNASRNFNEKRLKSLLVSETVGTLFSGRAHCF